MEVCIGAVGVLKKGPERDLIENYTERFSATGRHFGLRGITIKQLPVSGSLPNEKRQALEAEQLLALSSEDRATFVLDERGKNIDSHYLVSQLVKLNDSGISQLWFLIGGADGHGPAIKDKMAQKKITPISFGAATWPHMLVRVMLCEQLYRATTIMANHPYHRA